MEHEHVPDSRMKSRVSGALFMVLAVAAFFLLTEHRAHVAGWFSYWPYMLLLACPLMHIFMHGGHGHGASGHSEALNDAAKR
jgi:hypothetical protein